MQPNLEIIRGDTESIEISYDVDGTPLDLTDGTVFMTLKAAIDDSDDDAVLKGQTSTHLDPTNGITVITFSNTETAAVDPGVYFYDIQFKASDGTITSMPYRKIRVLPDITNRTS